MMKKTAVLVYDSFCNFDSAHFQRKVISETNILWYNILEVIKGISEP